MEPMEMNQTLTAGQIGKDRYRLYDGITGCYLFVGDEKALLLDTGFGNVPLREKAEELTAGLPGIFYCVHQELRL